MEAVPRLPMVSFQLKVSPEPTSFGKLKQYIRDFYNEDPESYTNEIHQLENLRAMAVRPPIAVTGCSLLKKYYCQLHFVQSRFPMGTDEPAAVPFSWKDTYANMVFTLSNIRFEIISILYNIGAIHSQLGSKTERTSADGMKMACSHFQCAAWAFEHLQNSYPQAPGVDMIPELMKFMHQLSSAQAQECILEKSMLDNRKPTTVAKVAKQIFDYYGLAHRTLEPNSDENVISETVGSKTYKNWKNYVKFKRSYYMAVTYLYQGLAAEEQQKMGERVAFYNAALASLNTSRQLHSGAKGSGGITGNASEKDAIEEALIFTNDVIEGKRKAAKNENEFIYHEEVPDKDSLPTVSGASLVKGITFNVNDPEISGPDIFARLVPMKVHEASSLYSEEKAKILRSVGAKIEEKDQVLETYLSSLKLQHLNLWDPDIAMNEDYLSLPEELVERCAALNAKQNAIKDLEDVMNKLSITYGDVETMLKDIDKFLKEEEQKERIYQEAMGKRPPSIVATDLTREAKKYEEAHAKASESNQALNRAMKLHLNNLQILSQPLSDLLSTIPSVKSSECELPSDGDKQNVRELKRILGKVEEMQKQRSDLHAKLRDSIAQDNLTRLLVTATAESVPLDALFAEQLEKHQSLVSLIEQNLAAQDNILTALTDAYARTAETRKSVEEILKKREIMITSLITSYDAYEDLLAKSSKGLEFYRKLEVSVTKLLQRVKSTCRVQEEEREQIIAKNEKPSVYESNDNTVSISVGEKKSGSGMKLRDHLMNRLKNPGNYYQYSDNKQQIPVAQPNQVLPGSGTQVPDAMGQYQDPSYAYYYQNQNYYPQQISNPYMAQYPANYDSGSGYNKNEMTGLPRSITTNSDNMYHQAGTTPTETASDSNNYAGYSNFKAEPDYSGNQAYPPSSQAQKNYSYPDYSAQKGQEYANYYQAHQVPQPPQVPVPETSGIDPKPAISISQSSSHALPGPSRPDVSVTPQTQVHQVPVSDNRDNYYPVAATQSLPANNYPTQNYAVNNSGPSGIPVGADQHMYYNQILPSGQLPSVTQQDNYPNYGQVYNQLSSNIPVNYPNEPDNIIQSHAKSGSYMPTNQNYQYSIQGHQSTGVIFPNYSQAYNNSGTWQNQSDSYKGHPGYSYDPVGGTYQYSSGYQQHNQSQSQEQSQIIGNDGSQNPANSYYTSANNGATTNLTSSPYPNGAIYQASYGDKDYYGNGQYGISGNEQNQVNQNGAPNQAHPGVIPNQTLQQPGMEQTQPIAPNQAQYQIGPNQVFQVSLSDQAAQGVAMNNQAPQHSLPNQTHNQVMPNQAYSGIMPNQPSHQPGLEQVPPMAPNQGMYQIGPNQILHTSVPDHVIQSAVINNQTPPHSLSNQPPQSTVPNQLPQSSVPNQVHHSITINNQVPQGTMPQNPASNQVPQSIPEQNYTQPSVTIKPETNSSATKPEPEKKSNLDLLADLDITINHAPLVPDIQPVDNVKIKDEILDEKDDNTETIAKDDNLQLDEKHENLQIVWDTWYNDVQPKRDPLGDPIVLKKFVNDIEKYEKFVDSLIVKTLSGSTNLEIKWKEIRDFELREIRKQSFTSALKHAEDNRTSDWTPYDATRVKLGADKIPDYINASHVKDLTQWTPMFIVTQAPIAHTIEAFWTMIWEQGSEVIACLCTDEQLDAQDIYWPDDQLVIGNFNLKLKTTTNHSTYVRRIIGINHHSDKYERIIVHMQYLLWPSSGLPSSPGALLSFATDIMSEQALRHCPKPIVVHDVNGGVLSGLFLLAASAVCHVRAGHGIIDVPLVLSTLAKYRKCLIDRESLLFGYRMVLYYAQDSLMKRGILSSTRSTFDGFDSLKGKGKSVKQCHPSDDFLHNLGVGGITRQQSNEATNQLQIKAKTNSDNEDKTDRVKPVDPLSQLDPLWSIRK